MLVRFEVLLDTTEILGICELQQSGEILLSADRGCNRSGERARLNSGDPGSPLFGRVKLLFFIVVPLVLTPPDIFVDVEDVLIHVVLLVGNAQLGLYDCVVLDAPG